jgi:predicted N-acyltransferase
MQTRVIESISQIDPGCWNALLNDTNPFVRHEFLAALEETGCVRPENGWLPRHLICENADGQLIGALPLYLKSNSYGEFVFDFSWANAYQQAGLNYYPKLTAAIPFSPATGPRVLTSNKHPDAVAIQQILVNAGIELTSSTNLSSLHVLFPDSSQIKLLESAGLLIRKDCQFHWHNDDYRNFDHFLERFTAVKRKKTRRERRRIEESGINFVTRRGAEIQDSDWAQIMPLYASTFLQRGSEPYLNEDFFRQLCVTMPENIVVFMGFQQQELVAIAICLQSDTTLYGRYWGAARYIDSLHFETCYYQGIDYCIQQGLQCFEPGTQGEHKISRGFVPTETWSAHWLSRPDFAAAIDDYLAKERDHIDDYIDAVGNHVPYRKDSS